MLHNLAFLCSLTSFALHAHMTRTFLCCAGKWTVQQAAELSVPAPTIEAALDGRFLSGLKDQRVKAAKFFEKLGATQPKQEPVS